MENNLAQFPLLRPATALYLLVPAILFSVGWLKPQFAILNVAILLFFAWTFQREIRQARLIAKAAKRPGVSWPLIASACILFGWLLLSGTGGFGFQVRDYNASNSLLKDLIEQDWPVTIPVEGVQLKYVYYVAYYLPAATLGKLFGWAPANLFLLAWTYAGLLLSFFWFLKITGIEKTSSKIVLLTGFFCLAGGMDLIGHLFFQNQWIEISAVNEWWAGYFQYSSNTTLLYWVPQQAIPGWLMIGLVVDMLDAPETSKYLGLILSLGVIWSPLAVIGLVPFCILLALKIVLAHGGLKQIASSWWRLNFFSIPIGLIHSLYIASNRLEFPIGIISSAQAGGGMRALKYLALFWLLEFGILGVLILILGRKNMPADRATWKDWLAMGNKKGQSQSVLFLLSLLVLFVLPLFKFGVHNDIVMRGGIPALFIFWAFVAKTLFNSAAEFRAQHKLLVALTVLVILIGFHPAIYSMVNSTRKFHFGSPDITAVTSSADANSREIVMQRLGDEDSLFFQYIGK